MPSPSVADTKRATIGAAIGPGPQHSRGRPYMCKHFPFSLFDLRKTAEGVFGCNPFYGIGRLPALLSQRRDCQGASTAAVVALRADAAGTEGQSVSTRDSKLSTRFGQAGRVFSAFLKVTMPSSPIYAAAGKDVRALLTAGSCGKTHCSAWWPAPRRWNHALRGREWGGLSAQASSSGPAEHTAPGTVS